MSSEFRNNLIALVLGWALGTLTQQIGRVFDNWKQKRKVLTRLHRILEEIFIDIEVEQASKKAGVLQTFEGYFDVDESWTQKLPRAVSCCSVLDRTPDQRVGGSSPPRLTMISKNYGRFQ